MNGCSSPGVPAASAAGDSLPHKITEESPVTRALEVVFQLQNAGVQRAPKRGHAEGPGAYALPPDPIAEQAEPDWKQRQAERIRAWRQKASLEPGLAVTGDQARSKEYKARARSGTQATAKSEQAGEDSDLDTDQQITAQPGFTGVGQGQAKLGGDTNQPSRANHVQAGPGGNPALQSIDQEQIEEDTGLASARKPGERLDFARCRQLPSSRKLKPSEESDEEACMAPCINDDKGSLAPVMKPREDEPEKMQSEKEESWANVPARVESSEHENKLCESRSLATNRTEEESRLLPGLSCSEQVDPGPTSIYKDSASDMTKGEQPGCSPSCQKGEDKSLESLADHQPETVVKQSDKPAADKSWALRQAAKIKIWRAVQSRELLLRHGIHVESAIGSKREVKKSIPVHAATGFGPERENTGKKVLEPVEAIGEQYGLSQSRNQARYLALGPDSMCLMPDSKQTLEALVGALQNTKHRESTVLTSSGGHQAEKVSATPVSEHAGSIAGGKPISDKNGLELQKLQAIKIKAWCYAASRSGVKTLPSNQNTEATSNPEHRAFETIPVKRFKTRWDSSYRGELSSTTSAPNVEAVNSSNRWAVESTPVQQVYRINPGTDSQRRVEIVHNTKQWTVDGTHVRQGPKTKIALTAPEIAFSNPDKRWVYGDKWWDVESISSHQSRGTGADWETSSSEKSSLMARDRNVKPGQLAVGSISMHQMAGFKPWWKAASEVDAHLEQNHLNFEAMHSTKQRAVESIPVCQTPGIGSWPEAASRERAVLLNMEAAHSSKWGTLESKPLRYTAGVSSCKEAASIEQSAFTWKQTMTTSSQHVLEKRASQNLLNDFSASWRGFGNGAGHQLGKGQDITRGKQDWLLSARRVSKLHRGPHSAFVAAEKKRMQDWAQSVWSQASSK